MSLTERLLELTVPDRSRWKPMLMGLVLSVACIEAVVLLKPSEPISAVLVVLVFVAWFVGACAMIGYVRWFFASELSQARRDKIDAAERENK
ncbi:MAG TPA: hypothetical protein VLD59_17345 [Steroidobacteraceae bacterium]|nr:hypothetical protein [Steroidobacteraceae bacterium]